MIKMKVNINQASITTMEFVEFSVKTIKLILWYEQIFNHFVLNLKAIFISFIGVGV